MADFDIGDVADLLGIRRLGQGDNFDVVCPYTALLSYHSRTQIQDTLSLWSIYFTLVHIHL